MTLDEFIAHYQRRIEAVLDRWLPPEHTLPGGLHRAMRYATLDGGKRVRPLLVYFTGEALGVDADRLDGPACAVELIHVYSLVHDDLPAMDNDDLRRGKPTCHKAFGEASAILVGDALQSLAFYVLAHDPAMIPDARARLQMIETLALASGSRGMAGGQAIDLAAVGHQLNVAALEDMHIHKTGALIRASVRLGALSSDQIDEDRLAALDHYAKCVGLAFQIRDDILDIEGDTEVIGKPQGSDQARNKPTYPSILGLQGSRTLLADLHAQALEALSGFDTRAQPLRDLADYIVTRQK